MIDIEYVRNYCSSKKATEESFPFDETTLVFKVGGKIFALLSLDHDHFLNLKCKPEKAVELREKYSYIKPGYHMNKKHWNTIDLNNAESTNIVNELIDNSYDLVFGSLSKKIREIISEL